MGPTPESYRELSVSSVAVDRLTEAAARQHEALPAVVGTRSHRSRAPPGTTACAREAAFDEEAFLSLMARLSLRVVRNTFGPGNDSHEIG